ncbi:MAG: ATP-binding protein [Candidatus Nezhaarchaeales archaeon]
MNEKLKSKSLGVCRHCHAKQAKIRLEYARLNLCEDCFVKFIERKVDRTIKKYGMIKKDDKILLALSGGKDSSALLHIIRRIMPEVKILCLHVDLGIAGFSEECRRKAEELVGQENVELEVVDLKNFLGRTLSELTLKYKKICSTCGLIRRYLLNYYGNIHDATKIATGHNLDDTIAVLWDFYVRGDLLEASRLQPVTQLIHPKALPRIKPLIELTDFELKAYVDLKGLPYTSAQCSFGRESKLNRRKRLINVIESMYPAFKHTLLKAHIKRVTPLISSLIAAERSDWKTCVKCGMPSRKETCGMCRLKESLKNEG